MLGTASRREPPLLGLLGLLGALVLVNTACGTNTLEARVNAQATEIALLRATVSPTPTTAPAPTAVSEEPTPEPTPPRRQRDPWQHRPGPRRPPGAGSVLPR